ncbi:uncharacterized protein LOC143215517 isoform X2 [Lasioglossum baleicum]|uniref:uncharacterized protein LOC143215517 isoform X2 n=1 Tax=Lasioglossum baleicum TaxID=434251 RepID=UPI003FCDF421
MYESVKNLANPKKDAKDLSIAIRRATVFRRHHAAPRRKNCWCSPRKADTMDSAKSVDDPTLKMDSKRQKKDRRRKAHRVSKKLRRIDVLAQPKSQNRSDPRKHSPSVSHTTKKVRYSELSTINEKQSRKSLKGDKKSKKLSKIMLSKKLQRRLISIVAKKIKELTNSGKIQ